MTEKPTSYVPRTMGAEYGHHLEGPAGDRLRDDIAAALHESGCDTPCCCGNCVTDADAVLAVVQPHIEEMQDHIGVLAKDSEDMRQYALKMQARAERAEAALASADQRIQVAQKLCDAYVDHRGAQGLAVSVRRALDPPDRAEETPEAAAPTVTPAVQEVVTLIEYALGDLDSGKPADAEAVLRSALTKARAASADPAHQRAEETPEAKEPADV